LENKKSEIVRKVKIVHEVSVSLFRDLFINL